MDKTKSIAAVTEAIKVKRRSPHLANEEILKSISEVVFAERSQKTKIGMIAAASKALEIMDKNPRASDKEIIREVMASLSDILGNIDEK